VHARQTFGTTFVVSSPQSGTFAGATSGLLNPDTVACLSQLAMSHTTGNWERCFSRNVDGDRPAPLRIGRESDKMRSAYDFSQAHWSN
jgi:hypothetical protein